MTSLPPLIHLVGVGIEIGHPLPDTVERMIVESGYDLSRLLFSGRDVSDALEMLALDGDMRPMWIRSVTAPFSGGLDPGILTAVEAVLDESDREDREGGDHYRVQFVALGHRVDRIEDYHEDVDRDLEHELEMRLGERSITLLGILGGAGEWWATTGPAHGFESYDIGDRVPRTLVIRAPHPFLACDCLVCTEGERRRGSVQNRVQS